MRVQLISENGKYGDLQFSVSQNPVVLGRSLRADVQFVHPLVSRLHCEWSLADGEVIVRDMESTNQTIVNGEPIEYAVRAIGRPAAVGRMGFSLWNSAEVPGEPRPLAGEESRPRFPTCCSIPKWIRKSPLRRFRWKTAPPSSQGIIGEFAGFLRASSSIPSAFSLIMGPMALIRYSSPSNNKCPIVL